MVDGGGCLAEEWLPICPQMARGGRPAWRAARTRGRVRGFARIPETDRTLRKEGASESRWNLGSPPRHSPRRRSECMVVGPLIYATKNRICIVSQDMVSCSAYLRAFHVLFYKSRFRRTAIIGLQAYRTSHLRRPSRTRPANQNSRNKSPGPRDKNRNLIITRMGEVLYTRAAPIYISIRAPPHRVRISTTWEAGRYAARGSFADFAARAARFLGSKRYRYGFATGRPSTFPFNSTAAPACGLK